MHPCCGVLPGWCSDRPYEVLRRLVLRLHATEHLVGATTHETFETRVREIMSEYKHVVTVEATGPEGKVYQRATFEQFYDSGEQQVANQENLFTNTVMGVMAASKNHRDSSVEVDAVKAAA